MDIGQLIDSNGEDTARWYKIPGSDARVHIRQMKPKRLRELSRECSTRRLIRAQYVDDMNADQLQAKMLDETVLGLEKIEMNGQPMECTAENKLILFDNWTEFAALWNAVVARDTEIDQAMREAELGNLPTGAGST